MKIRTDFVTNSSSSSFFLGLKDGKLTDKQKEIILNYIEKKMIGQPISFPKFKTEEELEEYLEENEIDFRLYQKEGLMNAIDKDMQIRQGTVNFDEESLWMLYDGLWEALDGVDGFEIIDGSLTY